MGKKITKTAKELKSEQNKRYYQRNKDAIKARSNISYSRNRAIWEEFKGMHACEFCENDHPAVLDFHHPPGVVKLGHVYDFVVRGNIHGALAEAAKCICLCSNCHRILHHELRIEEKEKKKRKRKQKSKTP
jgi:predicted HNH restriction endonuclease